MKRKRVDVLGSLLLKREEQDLSLNLKSELIRRVLSFVEEDEKMKHNMEIYISIVDCMVARFKDEIIELNYKEKDTTVKNRVSLSDIKMMLIQLAELLKIKPINDLDVSMKVYSLDKKMEDGLDGLYGSKYINNNWYIRCFNILYKIMSIISCNKIVELGDSKMARCRIRVLEDLDDLIIERQLREDAKDDFNNNQNKLRIYQRRKRREAKELYERQLIESLLAKGYTQTEIAKETGISQPSVCRKIKKYNIKGM